ncbi:hypothetical protein MMC16_000029 [Acarospora aff. strigata]|nr:hypothetical protein [Acarospora aff. strigata]
MVHQHHPPPYEVGGLLGVRSGENLALRRELGLPPPDRDRRRRGNSYDAYESSSSDDSDFPGGLGPMYQPQQVVVVPHVGGRRGHGSQYIHHHHHGQPRREMRVRHAQSPARLNDVLRHRSNHGGLALRRPLAVPPRAYRHEEADIDIDPVSDNESLFFSDGDTCASLETVTPRQVVRRHDAQFEPCNHRRRRRHRHRLGSLENIYADSDVVETGGRMNRVPCLNSRDVWRTGEDEVYASDGGVFDEDEGGSYHRRRPSQLTEESW